MKTAAMRTATRTPTAKGTTMSMRMTDEHMRRAERGAKAACNNGQAYAYPAEVVRLVGEIWFMRATLTRCQALALEAGWLKSKPQDIVKTARRLHNELCIGLEGADAKPESSTDDSPT